MHTVNSMSDKTFLRLEDRVCLAKPDGDGHIIGKESNGTVVTIVDQDKIEVKWDDGTRDWHSENDLDLI